MYPNKKILPFYYLLFLLFSASIYPQGAWTPAGADLTFPRTLLKSANIATVRSTLSSSGIIDLYAAIYSNANATIPSGSTDIERLTKSHIAKDIAFVILMNRKYEEGVVDDLSPSDVTALQTKVVTLLGSFETNVDRITTGNLTAYDNWQWRSKELIDYCSAYDLLKGAGVDDVTLTTAKSHIQTFAGNLYLEATRAFILTYTFFNQVINNHSLMTASALGFAAVVLNDCTSADANYQPTSWIGAAMVNIENVLFINAKRMSEPNVMAGYYEGPGYLRYAFLNCLPFFRSMGNILPDGSLLYTYSTTVNRSIENPFYDTRYNYLYDWVTKIRLPDGRMPMSEDTYIKDSFPELALTGNSKYNWANSFNGYGSSLLLQLQNGRTELWANYISANPQASVFSDTLFQALPTSGDLVFRSAYSGPGTYMHVTAKNGNARANSYGHNQADVSSFMIYNNGEMLALDPGYIDYNDRTSVGTADEHNMILVDGGGPAIGTTTVSNDVDGYIENTFTTPNLSYGEARTNYSSVDINRKFLFVRNKYYIDADFISGAASHNYTYQLHGHGLEGYLAADSGSFTDNLASGEGIWSKGSESLLAHMTANGGVTNFSKVTKTNEVDAGTPGTHTAVYANKNGVQNTEFLMALYPYESSPATITTLNGSPFTAIKVVDGIYTDLAFTQEGTSLQILSSAISGMADNIGTDATFALYTLKNGAFDEAFIKNGTRLATTSMTVIDATTRMDVYIQSVGSGTYYGYVSAAGTVNFNINQILGVTGNNITSYGISAFAGYSNIVFSGPSTFTITAVMPVELTSFTAAASGNKIILNWVTVTEIGNHGFDIERMNSGKIWNKIGFVNGAGNSNSTKNYSFTDANPLSGKNIYRLKQIDKDGKFTYSQTIEGNGSTIPQEYSLGQNYPNPFNPSTIIRFSLPFDSQVKMTLYNELGESVKELVNETKNAGAYEINFNANGLASGVYYYTIKANSADGKQNFKTTKKMVLLH